MENSSGIAKTENKIFKVLQLLSVKNLKGNFTTCKIKESKYLPISLASLRQRARISKPATSVPNQDLSLK